jgi:hypothetical protein
VLLIESVIKEPEKCVVSSPFFYTKDEKTSKQKIRIIPFFSLADISLGGEGIIRHDRIQN